MKKYLFLLAMIVFTTSALSAKQTNLHAKLTHPVKDVVPFTDLTPSLVSELLAGKHPHIAIECLEGQKLPVHYFGNFGLFSVALSPNLSIEIKQTCYLRLIKKNKSKIKTFISFDLINWEQAKNLLPEEGVNITVGMSPDKSQVIIDTSPKQ